MSKGKNKIRFSDDQIRSLESLFDSESRPESQAKQRIADELGLEPRQVAIWFQNRRARCKLKQIESEYNVLKASHDELAARFDSLKNEHQCLVNELERLKDAQKRPKGGNELQQDAYEQEKSCENEAANMAKTTMFSGNCYMSLESVVHQNCDSEWWEQLGVNGDCGNYSPS